MRGGAVNPPITTSASQLSPSSPLCPADLTVMYRNAIHGLDRFPSPLCMSPRTLTHPRIPDACRPGGKVVIFSSWERMLEYAASALTAEGWSVATLNGRGTAEGKEENDRQQEMFKRDKSERESAKDGGEEDERVAEQQGRDPEILSSTPGLKPVSYICAVYM